MRLHWFLRSSVSAACSSAAASPVPCHSGRTAMPRKRPSSGLTCGRQSFRQFPALRKWRQKPTKHRGAFEGFLASALCLHMRRACSCFRCLRFASLISAISSRSFLIRSDTNFGIDTAYSSEGLGGLFSQFRKAVRVTRHIPLYSSSSLKPVGVHPLMGTI